VSAIPVSHSHRARRELRALAPIVFALIGVALAGSPALAAKTDVIVLKNGDRLTGEVDQLERGKLTTSRA
jgi:hypothetical protein